MSRAYICLVRNDLDNNLLQVLDLKPNTSQMVPSLMPAGQTGYVTWSAQMDAVSVSDSGAGVYTTDADYYGLAAYVLDNIENVGGGDLAMTLAQANSIQDALWYQVTHGLSLTLSDINTAINGVGGVSISDLNGVVGGSFSTGSVEEVLRIMSGEAYFLPAGTAISDAGNAFHEPHTRQGGFLTASDAGFRNFRKLVNGGSLQLSALSGQLSKLKSTGFAWLNPSFTYGASGTAIAYGHIPVTGVYPALTVYDNGGNVI